MAPRSVGAPLAILDRWDLPIREASGLALRRVGSTVQLIAVGDSGVHVVAIDITHGRPGSVVVVDVVGWNEPGADSQFEAVAVDRRGRLAILREVPPLVVFVDADTGALAERVALHADDDHPSHWRTRRDGQGEGLVFGDEGLLVAKEKRPAGLLQFVSAAQPGDHRVPPSTTSSAAGWWEIDELDDVSDVCFGPDRRMYVLSDQSQCIARLGPLPPGGGRVDVEAIWSFDAENAEGLVVLDDMTPLVAVDAKRQRENLLVLAPLTGALG